MPLLLALRFWEQSLVVLPPPAPPDERCFRPVALTAALFARMEAPGCVATTTPPICFQTVAAPTALFARMDDPACAPELGLPGSSEPGIGYGTDYGYDFGGG